MQDPQSQASTACFITWEEARGKRGVWWAWPHRLSKAGLLLHWKSNRWLNKVGRGEDSTDILKNIPGAACREYTEGPAVMEKSGSEGSQEGPTLFSKTSISDHRRWLKAAR